MIVQTHNDDVQNEGLFIFLSQSEQHCIEGKTVIFFNNFCFSCKKNKLKKTSSYSNKLL
jgi:hypothetical protein